MASQISDWGDMKPYWDSKLLIGQVDFDYWVDPVFHAAVKATVVRELIDQQLIRALIQREKRGFLVSSES